ncbi:MAG: YqeG family HAD IIIA-type phosphatase [Defluviitaleaceae bacterium]|nr:YqeG family HAD IIIA-type phosphatase [Defluviitaleaceae bacterium]MCL2275111.1 YqeG family HAD IIIA-type phosphatase [Defluviitaleaceae bacterium]
MSLAPDYYLNSVLDIPYERLWQQNIRGLIYDLDNTLAHFDRSNTVDGIQEMLVRLQKMGFAICLLTNNTNGRLRLFSHLQLNGIANALKPMTRGVRQAMQLMGTTQAQTAIIGDQLFSDVWAGKNAGITTILVKPLTEKDFFFVKFKRLFERWLLKRYGIHEA